jgi:hypothetical protein
MQLPNLIVGWVCTTATIAHSASSDVKKGGFDLQPFIINLNEDVDRLLELSRATLLPDSPEYPGDNDSTAAGIDLNILKSLRGQWTTEFDWQTEQDDMNRSAWQSR